MAVGSDFDSNLDQDAPLSSEISDESQSADSALAPGSDDDAFDSDSATPDDVGSDSSLTENDNNSQEPSAYDAEADESGGEATDENPSVEDAVQTEVAEHAGASNLNQNWVQTIADGTYVIESASNLDQVLDVVASETYAGANVTTWNNDDHSNQKWIVTYLGNGLYKFTAEHSGQVLDVVASGTIDGTNVTQWSWTGGDNQQWYIQDAGNGLYYIISKCSGLYLDIEGGRAGNSVNVQTWSRTDNNGGLGQMFRFSKMLANGYYSIASFDNRGYFLDVEGSSVKDGANVSLWSGTGAVNQKFEIVRLHGTYYRVTAVNSWKSLDVVAGGQTNGTNVTQWTQYGTANQAWHIEILADGSVRFQSEVNGLYLDVQGGYAGRSVNVQTWELTNNNAGRGQQWFLAEEKLGWVTENGATYYYGFDTGWKYTGSHKIDGYWYYFDGDGRLNRQAAINRVLSTAQSLLGVPYVWLGVYPRDGGMDCASFTWYVYKQLGIDIGFETYDQQNFGISVSSLSQARPGDLILMYNGSWPNYNYGLYEHVVLYAGNGMIYEEPTFGGYCQYVSLASKGAANIRIRRVFV